MKEKKKNSIIAAVCTVIAIVIGSTFIINAIPKEEPKPDEPPVIETPGENETPDVPENPIELLTKVDLTYSTVDYTTVGGTPFQSYWVVPVESINNTTDKFTGNVAKFEWGSSRLVSLNINLSDYDVANSTHLTFWLGSEPLTYDSGWAKFVQDPDLTVFSEGQYFTSDDSTTPDTKPNYTRFGDWRKFEIPIADVVEFYETNGTVTLFYFMSSGLTGNSVYLGDVQFENLTE